MKFVSWIRNSPENEKLNNHIVHIRRDRDCEKTLRGLADEKLEAVQKENTRLKMALEKCFEYIDTNVSLCGEADWKVKVQLEDLKQYLTQELEGLEGEKWRHS